MKCDKKGLLLYAVTDRSWLNGETLYSQVEKALQGGATFIQLREKNLDQDHFMEEALELKKLCAAKIFCRIYRAAMSACSFRHQR